jgi:hypothetical protein
MLSRLRGWLPSRVAAALVVSALSGAPALASAAAPASTRGACACASHGRNGACTCAPSRLARGRDAVRKAPPCHPSSDARSGRRGAATCARLTGPCGVPDGQVPPPRAVEPFQAPGAIALAPRLLAERLATVDAVGSEVPRLPPRPPPRPA